jgi:hypothetical protein
MPALMHHIDCFIDSASQWRPCPHSSHQHSPNFEGLTAWFTGTITPPQVNVQNTL